VSLKKSSEAGVGAVPAKGLAWPFVELAGDGVEVVGGVDGQVAAFREVLAQQAVRVLLVGPKSSWSAAWLERS